MAYSEGHSCVPPIVSYDVASIFRKGKTDLDHEFWGKCFPSTNTGISVTILVTGFLNLKAKFGDFQIP
jgi:hypothetical protein